jgi:hypothetical protein
VRGGRKMKETAGCKRCDIRADLPIKALAISQVLSCVRRLEWNTNGS